MFIPMVKITLEVMKMVIPIVIPKIIAQTLNLVVGTNTEFSYDDQDYAGHILDIEEIS